MPQSQNWLQRHVVAVLYSLFGTSLLLMLGTIACFCIYFFISLTKNDDYNVAHTSYDREISIAIMAFFGTTNAMIIFRVFTMNKFIIVLHIVLHFCVLICLLLNAFLFSGDDTSKFHEVFQIPAFFLIAVYFLQSFVAFFLVFSRPGLTPLQQEMRAGIHCFVGLVTLAIQLWNVLLHISMMCSSPRHIGGDQKIHVNDMLPEPMILSVLINFYTLAIIVILLTPYFEAEYLEDIIEMNKEREEKEKLKKQMSHYPSIVQVDTHPQEIKAKN